MNAPFGRPAVPPPSLLRLGERSLDLAGQVLRNADGQPIDLRPQAWAVLQLLALNAGRVVTKEELLAAVWPGLVVTDSSIAQAVSDVRAALGDGDRSIVRTVARRGYLLLADGVPAATGETQPAANPGVLPAPAERLFGREAELAALRGLLSQYRLVTVVGGGGIGKTVLALHAVHEVANHPVGEASWADLSRVSDPALLPVTAAQALGLQLARDVDLLPGLLMAVRPLGALLVLDNAEHLVDAVAQLTRALLGAAPHLRVLVTSQAPLRIEGERVFRLASLAVPTKDASLADALTFGAVKLFVDQAQAVDHRFDLTVENVGAVVRLCRRLEGLPLAIRLAAARLPLLGLDGLEERLHERLQLLYADRRDAPSRQQTLLAALEWSYGLLAPAEQTLFRRLGVFVGGFSLDLATAVCREPDSDDWEVARHLGTLVERSLVELDRGPSRPRYRLLDTQRSYALRLLSANGEIDDLRRRHARMMAEEMDHAFVAMWAVSDEQWLPRTRPELDNVRAALRWSLQHEPPTCVWLLADAVGLFHLSGADYELMTYAAAIDDATVDATSPLIQARYWLMQALRTIGLAVDDMHRAAAKAEQAARQAGDRQLLFMALCQRLSSTRVPEAEIGRLLDEIDGLEQPDWPARVRLSRFGALYGLNSAGGRWAEALRAAESGLALGIRCGAMFARSVNAMRIVGALLALRRPDEALRRAAELEQAVNSGAADMAIPFLGLHAAAFALTGNRPEARRRYAEVFERCRVVHWAGFGMFAASFVHLALTEGRFESAARLLGHSESAARGAWGAAVWAPYGEVARAELAEVLGTRLLQKLMADGERLDREAVCALVLETPIADRAQRARSKRSAGR